MSVLIKGMDEIPEDGAVLVVMHDNGKAYIKHACTYGYSMELVKLPKTHGRLIDADALANDLDYDASHFDEDHEMKSNCASWLRSNATPTAIEAEGEEC